MQSIVIILSTEVTSKTTQRITEPKKLDRGLYHLTQFKQPLYHRLLHILEYPLREKKAII